MRGQEPVIFRREQTSRIASALALKPRERIPLDPAATQLFAQLKAERAYLARTQGLPAFVIFQDDTLVQIARARPRTLNDLQKIPGMGRSKVEKYGSNILDAIKAFEEPETDDVEAVE